MLTMMTHPECQRKAQEELDRVIGNHRLPTFEDYADLPYLYQRYFTGDIALVPCLAFIVPPFIGPGSCLQRVSPS